ncbi:MAG: carboxypeptidase-like regulatory domain-containing protein, partial [Acidobacteriota bacterium]
MRAGFWRGVPPPVIVEVDGRSDVAGIVITVQEPDGAEISGVAVDDLGRSLEGAVIQASSPDSPFNSTTSRSDGSFVLETKGEGPLQVTAEKVNHTRGLLSGLEVGSRNIRLVLERYGQVSGRVVTPDGGRLPQGGRVELFAGPEEGGVAPFRMPFGPSAFVKPGEDGSFRFDSKAGQVELVARFEGSAPLRSSAVTVRPGEETGGIELVLSSGSRLLGSVLFKDGRPVEGAQVVASSAGPAGIAAGFYDERAVTDRRGRFKMPHLEAGQYSLSSTYPGYAPS